jgi:hypothetical protein
VKHLKKFNESTESKKRLSVEDIEDYFLEFIDNGSMEFYYNNLPTLYEGTEANKRFIHTTFRLSDKFRDITTPEELNNFSSLINKIGEVVKRWNLDFKFSTIRSDEQPGGAGAFQTELSIIQPIPKVVIDFANQNPLVRNRVVLDKMIVDYFKDIDVDDNSDFILTVKVKNLFSGGSGLSGKWLKEDYQNFSNSEEEFIKFFVDNKEVPCEFIKKVPSTDMRYGKPFYEMWYFKLLV